jgi:hypothetical protein
MINGKRCTEFEKKAKMETKRPISTRKLQANRNNAKRSTGPKSERGKAFSRRNALKHGILSCSVDFPDGTAAADSSLLQLSGSHSSEMLRAESTEIGSIWGKLARVVAFERECAEHPGGLERNAHLICRYERTLTRQLHARIRECAGISDDDLKEKRSSR